ncbi:uncharacterized protein KRP23_11751 [Phytophthora ramorum]|uniref:uncharacterized protein n=1 Tax=Phytophthora ramorum TaxID=164328 RepID=UPI00309A3AA6|nr:hypothetical protein KRP23_11751 [Phytophthora ramorum]
MRVSYAVQGLLVASTTMAASSNPQHVVLGTDGTVVVGADPSLYFQTSKYQVYRDQGELESVHSVDSDPEMQDSKPIESDELSLVMLPTVHDELLVANDLDSDIQQTHGDDFYSSTMLQDTSPMPWNTLAMTEDSEIPGVYGSVVFAELSCCFVAFIGYLMRSIPLWIGFSRGQKCCLVVAFSMAVLYQLAALGWVFGALTPELMLGLSSLITRMISLGMVPITTTSFMGRAREICQEHTTMTPSGRRKSRSSRRHHARARSS